jgi:anthranilate phosphoribosyltransferase
MEHPNLLTPETFKPLLKTLITTPSSFTPQLATLAFEHLASGPFSVSEVQVASFLTALTLSSLDQSAEVVAAAAKVMRRYSVPVELGELKGQEGKRVVDIVGTGGDGHDTFNVSTSAGIVAAGAGAVVCKVSLIGC